MPDAETPRRLRISLVWKLVIPTLVVVLLVAAAIVYRSWSGWSQRTLETAKVELTSDARLLAELMVQLRNELAQTGSNLVVNLSAGGEADWLESLNRSPDLFARLNWLRLYDSQGRLLLNWSPAEEPSAEADTVHQGLLARARRNLSPEGGLYCEQSCEYLVAAPVMTADDQQRLLLIAAPIADLVYSYSNLAGGDLALLARQPGAGMQAVAVSRPEVSDQRLLRAAWQAPRDQVEPGLHGGWAYQVSDLAEATLGPSSVVAVSLLDLSASFREARRQALFNLAAQIVLMGIVLGLIVWLLSGSLRRLRTLIALLPEMSEEDQRRTRKHLENAFPESVWRDEVDSLRDSLLWLSDELHKLHGVEAASEAKSRFLATMSHEIRTPMSGIIGLAEILEKTRLDEDQQRMMGMILESTTNLMGIINDVLDYSKIEADAMTLNEEGFDPCVLLEQVAEACAGSARAKGLALKVLPAVGLPAQVRADRGKLRQILLNLVSNAIKFTIQGDVAIRLQTRVVSGRTHLCFDVSDTGPGIAPDSQERVFQRFVQADSSTTRRYGGTGLGLPISRGLAELMHGTLTLDSAPGSGATFSLSIPIGLLEAAAVPQGVLDGWHVVVDLEGRERLCVIEALQAEGAVICPSSDDLLGQSGTTALLKLGQGDVQLTIRDRHSSLERRLMRPVHPHRLAHDLARIASTHSTPEHSRPGGNTAPQFGLHVLVVEDQPVNRELICRQLQQLGCTYRAAENGESGLAALREQSFDLVITDLHMPLMDGYELTREIRAGDHLNKPDMPVAVLTASASQQDMRALQELQITRKLVKPLKLSALSAFLSALALTSAPEREAPRPEVQEPLELNHVDKELLIDVLGPELTGLGRFVDAFEQANRPLLAQCKDAVEHTRWSELHDLVHRLKGSSRSLGGTRLGDAFEQLELAAEKPQAWHQQRLGEIQLEFDGLMRELSALAGR